MMSIGSGVDERCIWSVRSKAETAKLIKWEEPNIDIVINDMAAGENIKHTGYPAFAQHFESVLVVS